MMSGCQEGHSVNMAYQWWVSARVADGGPALSQHKVNMLCSHTIPTYNISNGSSECRCCDALYHLLTLKSLN